LLLNASSNRAAREGGIVSGRKRRPYTSETRLVARAIVLNARQMRSSGVLSPYAKVRHLPCALSWWGRVFANTRTRGMLCWAGLNLMSKQRASDVKSTTDTPHSLRNGRHPPTATRGHDRDQLPSQLHASSEQHSDVQIEERTVGYHDQRSGEPRNAPPSRLEIFEGGELFAVLDPSLQGTGRSEKKTDSGPDFRLTRSRHPSASGRRIGSSAGDGWAARRDPETNSGVFYWAGL
jgi:hypothetical protein